MTSNGYIKLHRKLLNWGWYKDQNTLAVFLHLLLIASFAETEYMGVKIYPGQAVIGRKSLAKALGISEQNIRTALVHLKSTNEITIKATNRFSVVTIVNWESYQFADNELTNEITNEPHNSQPTTNHIIRNKEYIDIYRGVPDQIKDAFAEWAEMRVGIGRPIITEAAVSRAVNKLNSLSSDPETQIKIIHEAINHNWLSFYPLKEPKPPSKPNGKSNGKSKAAELDDFYAMTEAWANGQAGISEDQ